MALDNKYPEFVKTVRKTPPVPCEFEIGEKVAFVNEAGIIFLNLEIIGFAEDDSFYGRFIYTNSDAWWYASKPSELRKLDANGMCEIKEGEYLYNGDGITILMPSAKDLVP